MPRFSTVGIRAGLAMLASIAGCALLAPTPVPFESHTGDLVVDYLYYYEGRPIGWRRTAVRKAIAGDNEFRTVRSHAYVTLARDQDGTVFSLEEWSSALYDNTWSEIESTWIKSDSYDSRQVDAAWGERIQVTDSKSGVGKTVLPISPAVAEAFSEPAATRLLLSSPPGTSCRVRTFDHDRVQLELSTWTYLGLIDLPGHNSAVRRGHAIRRGASPRAAVALYDEHEVLTLVRHSNGMTMERVAEIPVPFSLARVSVKTSLDTDQVIRGPDELIEMELEITATQGEATTSQLSFQQSSYHSVAGTQSGWVLRLKAQTPPPFRLRARFATGGIPEHLKSYVKPTRKYQSDNPDIFAKAQELAADGDTWEEVLASMTDFVRRRLAPGVGYATDGSAAQAYAARAGDCSEAASLLVALARATNIPARRAKGLIYWPGNLNSPNPAACFAFHAWVEVWVGEWIPIDPTTGDIGTAARYIWLQEDSDGFAVEHPTMAALVRHPHTLRINYYKRKDMTYWTRAGTDLHFD